MITETVFDFPSPLAHDHANPLLELNLKVAAIAGWENIQEWNPSHKPKKVFQGTNKKHPELGIFVPDYVRDLNAIESLLDRLDVGYQVIRWKTGNQKSGKYNIFFEGIAAEYRDKSATNYVWFDSLPLGLCKLLLERAPQLSDVKTIDDDGEVDEPTVIE